MRLSGHAHASRPAPTLAYARLPACARACPPVPVGKFFFSFLSACVHDCNLHAPTRASTPLPAPTRMRLSGHAHAFSPTPACAHLLQLRLPGHARLLAWAWACPCLPHPCARVSATPVAMCLTSSCTQRSPQLWVFSDAGAVNSTKGVSGSQRVYSYLSTMALGCGYRRRAYGYGYVTRTGWLNPCQSYS